MKVKITPSTVRGGLKIPPSKSMTHRSIICASLAEGTSIISNVVYSDDIKATLAGMEQLGARIKRFDDVLIIQGVRDFKQMKESIVCCNESGSTLRFFIPLFSLCDKRITFKGKNRLLQRPQTIYEDLFHSQGIMYNHTDDGIEIGGSLKSGEYSINGNISSQFISGLLFTLPLLDGDSIIHIKEPYESKSYVDLTLQMLHNYGIKATYSDANTLSIAGNQRYQPHDYHIEADYSQFAFFAVLATINHDLDCVGLNHDSLQGDKQILTILENAGITIDKLSNGYRIKKGVPKAQAIDLQNCPDLGPILNVLAMYSEGSTRIYNAQRLRYKESDRIVAMEEELQKCNVSIQTSENEIIIEGNTQYTCQQVLNAHRDHRIVMSLAVAATVFKNSVIIEGAEAIKKSYPSFFEDMKSIGCQIEVFDD